MDRIFQNPALFNRRARRTYRNKPTHIADTFTEKEIKDRYRFNRDSIRYICDLVRADLQRPTRRNHAMTVEEQVCIGLRFLASGSFQQVVGDISGRDKSTVCRVITEFCKSIVRKRALFVCFPNDEQKQQNKELFFDMAGFPSVIGCVDGFHVKIITPSENERDFINRKGWHSINVQAMTSPTCKFIDAIVKWPGSTHDSFVFRFSDVKQFLDENHLEISDGLVLGDSGYPLVRYLMTPYQNPGSPEEVRYNRAHTSTRSSIERTIGQMKRRFPCLHSGLRVDPSKACLIISTCIVLHNIAKEIGDEDFESENENFDCPPMPEEYDARHNDAGVFVRRHITTSFFGY